MMMMMMMMMMMIIIIIIIIIIITISFLGRVEDVVTRMHDREIVFRFLARTNNVSLLPKNQTGSRVHPATHSVGSEDSFAGA